MLEFILGGILSVAVSGVVWSRRHNRLREDYRNLLKDSQEQLYAYAEFRQQFEQYRARFDPVNTSRIGNVVQIERGKKQ